MGFTDKAANHESRNHLLVRLFWEPTGAYQISRVAIILILLLGITVLIFLTGGTPNPLVHLMYGPILLIAISGNPWVAGATGVIAGLLAGPLVQHSVGNAEQVQNGWLVRLLIYTAMGVSAALVCRRLRHSLDETRHMNERLARSYGRMLRTLAGLVAERDEQTGAHCERVAYYAHAIGKKLLGDTHPFLEVLYWAGYLHDLGKIGIPEYILQKPSKLSEEEYRVVQRHAKLGAQILSSASAEFERIAEAVQAHHERWDGKGYPQGLSGEAIPLTGRILAVADVFEVLTHDRPYRKAISVEEALAELERNAGRQFDPQVVKALVQLVRAGSIKTNEVPPLLYGEVPIFELYSLATRATLSN